MTQNIEQQKPKAGILKRIGAIIALSLGIGTATTTTVHASAGEPNARDTIKTICTEYAHATSTPSALISTALPLHKMEATWANTVLDDFDVKALSKNLRKARTAYQALMASTIAPGLDLEATTNAVNTILEWLKRSGQHMGALDRNVPEGEIRNNLSQALKISAGHSLGISSNNLAHEVHAYRTNPTAFYAVHDFCVAFNNVSVLSQGISPSVNTDLQAHSDVLRTSVRAFINGAIQYIVDTSKTQGDVFPPAVGTYSTYQNLCFKKAAELGKLNIIVGGNYFEVAEPCKASLLRNPVY